VIRHKIAIDIIILEFGGCLAISDLGTSSTLISQCGPVHSGGHEHPGFGSEGDT